MRKLIDEFARIGFHGLIGFAVVLAVIFISAYGFIYRPDHPLTADAVTALIIGVGAVIGAAVFMLRGGTE